MERRLTVYKADEALDITAEAARGRIKVADNVAQRIRRAVVPLMVGTTTWIIVMTMWAIGVAIISLWIMTLWVLVHAVTGAQDG